jgi:NADPH2:quinone reductase
VIAVARGAERLEIARAAGADHVIDSATADLRAELRALGGADVVYDPVGGEAFEAAFRAVRPEARILVIGFASGSVPQVRANHLLVKNIDVMGFWWGGYLAFRPDLLSGSLGTLLGWYAEGRIRPHIGAVLPLEQAAEGLAMLRERRATGKIVVTI